MSQVEPEYSQFCERYRQFTKRVDAVMRQEHRAGEKCFVDYSRVKPKIVDRKTGEVIEVELFVGRRARDLPPERPPEIGRAPAAAPARSWA